ncbi:hypothetical protein G5714_023078 [Onychostoma macrolepis]|uniref:Uncharacterized protein n=1 Tax=Onychostoma macrolepis TaxID=369639 RepID=A0A7J6BMK2_9TELE|nr:hypothetical protein G5714_023078 [Onychostoma macrolepis]
MSFITIFIWIFTSCCFTESAAGVTVTQTPAVKPVQPGDTSVEDRSPSLRVPQRQQLDQKKQSKSTVKPAEMCTRVVQFIF